MEIVLAVVVGIVALKTPAVGVAGLGQIRPPLLGVCSGVGLEEIDVILGRHHLLKARADVPEAGRTKLKDIRQAFERLRRGVGPTLAAPPAAARLEQKERIVAFDRRGAEVGPEELGVDQILPGLLVAFSPRRHVKLPGDVADQFAAVRAASKAPRVIDPAPGGNGSAVERFIVAEGGEEESTSLIPQSRFHFLAERLGGRAVLGGQSGVSDEILHPRKRLKIGPLVGDETRPVTRCPAEDVFRLATGDVELHAVVVAHLPGEPGRLDEVPVAPGLCVGFQAGEDIAGKDISSRGGRGVGRPEMEPCRVNQMDPPDRVREPGGVGARLGAGGVYPVSGVVAGHPRRTQPAGLVKLVACGAGDRSVGPRPEWPVEEFSE